MTRFADQLFDDLMREHGAALAASPAPALPKRRLVTRPLLLTAGAGALAAVAAAGGILAARGGPPAYAVTSHPDGTVSLAVYQQSAIASANTKLRTLGDQQVVVVAVKAGCPSIDSLAAPAGSGRSGGYIALHLQSTTSVDGAGTVNVDAHGIPKGDLLVVAFETTGTGSDRMTLGVTRLTSGPAPSCVSIPPAAPAGATTSGGGS